MCRVTSAGYRRVQKIMIGLLTSKTIVGRGQGDDRWTSLFIGDPCYFSPATFGQIIVGMFCVPRNQEHPPPQGIYAGREKGVAFPWDEFGTDYGRQRLSGAETSPALYP